MKNYHLYILILILFSCSFLACKKQLNVYPTTTEVDGAVIVDEKSASAALNGVYYNLAGGGTDYNGVPVTKWHQINEELPGLLSGMLSNPYGGGLDEHTYNAKSYKVDNVWNYGYAIVNAANGFLKNVASVTTIASDSKSRMIAEAKFLRAFANTELLLYYGQYFDTTSVYGIILRDEFVRPDNLYLSRSSVGQAYGSILNDLSDAIPHLPLTNTQIWYANVWAAKLLKARVLMNRGFMTDYAQVISLTQDIITNGPFTLETNAKDIFLSKGLTSNEIILGITPFAKQSEKWKSYIFYDDFGPNAFMQGLFNGDPRAAWNIQTVNTAYGGGMIALTKYYPGSATDIAAAPVTENGYAFRLTEAYLLEAEALVASGGSMDDAKTLLKTIMGHAGIADFSAVDAAATPGGLQLLIIEEEMKNFVAEAGQDWFAVRHLPFTTLQSLLPSVRNKSLLILPIPYSEMKTNPAVKQNPDYE